MYMQHMYTSLYVDWVANFMSGMTHMAKTVRLSETEQEKIRNKAVEINKKLVDQMKQPLKDSELVHVILEEAIERLEVTKSGKVIIN